MIKHPMKKMPLALKFIVVCIFCIGIIVLIGVLISHFSKP